MAILFLVPQAADPIYELHCSEFCALLLMPILLDMDARDDTLTWLGIYTWNRSVPSALSLNCLALVRIL